MNGAMWELITAGYANIMALGIRKLVDRDTRTDSVWNVVVQVEKRPELLRRENFICYDGLPYAYRAVMQRHIDSGAFGQDQAVWMSTKGPMAWSTSELLHQAFDALAGYPEQRKRLDMVQAGILAKLEGPSRARGASGLSAPWPTRPLPMPSGLLKAPRPYRLSPMPWS